MHRKDEEPTKRPAKKNRELLACEARLRTVMTKSPYGMLVVDANRTILFANLAASVIYGCSATELLGRKFAPRIEPGKTIETTMQGRDGQPVVVELWGEETVWDAGEAWFICLVDVSERRRNEQEQRKFQRAILESPSIVLITDVKGVIEFVNPKFTTVTGYTFAEVVGKNPRILKSGKVPPEVYKELWETILTGKEWRGEMINRRKNGELYWEYAAISSFKDMDGKIINFIAVTEDITERKRTEEELQASRERFHSLFFNMAEGVALHELVYDDRGTAVNYRLVDINPSYEKILHLRREEVVGRLATEVYGVAAPPYLAEFSDVAISRTARLVETYFPPMARHFDISIVPWGSCGFATIFTDITERRWAEEKIESLNTDLAARAIELESANRELEAFSYTVSHDLRRPLTVINSYCQVVQEMCGPKLDNQCQEYIREIYDGTLRMNGFIDTLLNFSRLTHCEVHRETVNLSEKAKAVAIGLKMTEPERGVTFHIAEGITVNGDKNLLQAVMENLLGNAWKYTGTRDDAVIEFGVMEVEGMPTYFVRDNGTGLDMTHADRLFIPFQRLPGTDVEGHGIGLATVERIIRRHGGKVWAEGKPGKGATFYFTLQH